MVYKLGARWFGRAAGALAALVLLTRVPILSYGVRAYVDIPYLLLVLGALLVETRRRRAGAPVLALLALAGLLRPEAWAFSGIYWLYLLRGRGADEDRAQLAWVTLLAACAPIVWLASDLAITGKPLWSLTNTRHTAHTLGRITGIGNAPEYIPRRIGEILRPPVLAGAALGGVLSLLWLRRRALTGAIAGIIAVAVFAAVAAAGLSINTRYAFPAAALLCVFCGAGAFGWTQLAPDERSRRWWMLAGAAILAALAAYVPAQYRSAHRELDKLGRQQRIQSDLLALVDARALSLRCGPIGVPNHAPIPLLALYLKTGPGRVVSAQVSAISSGQYVDPASRATVDAQDAVSVTARARTSDTGTVLLTVLADGDLANGPNALDISQLSWLASGLGFVPGTMSKSAAQTLGMWTGPGVRAGNIQYRLSNGYGVPTGTYTTTLTYTLMAP